jgi:hypothetical protein
MFVTIAPANRCYDTARWSVGLEPVMRMTSVVSDSVACPAGRESRRLAGLGVVCLVSVLGIIISGLVCFLGFRNEVTAALSDDMTGSITLQDRIMKVEVNNPAVEQVDSHH